MFQLTILLARVRFGEAAAEAALVASAYPKLRRFLLVWLTAQPVRVGPPPSRALALAFCQQLVEDRELRSEDQDAFLRYAPRILRLAFADIEQARIAQWRSAVAEDPPRRQGRSEREEAADRLLRLDGTLRALACIDPYLARIARMHYLEGCSQLEIGLRLGVGRRAVQRDWSRARLALRAILLRG